jgi:hypothetical protein
MSAQAISQLPHIPSFTPSASTPPVRSSLGASPQPDPVVVQGFVDFWNFQLAMNRWRRPFRFDWSRLGPSLTKQVEALWRASGLAGQVQYGGLHLYISHNPAAPHDEGLRQWARNVLGRFDGVHVVLKERRSKDPPTCPGCHGPVATCPCCGASMHRTTEKGMDAAIVTDMVRLAWEDRWNAAVLVSCDGDFVPAVEHLQQKGHAVVHAGFAPNRSALARTCCASLDIGGVLRSIESTRGRATARVRRVLAGAESTVEAKKVLREVRKTDLCGD